MDQLISTVHYMYMREYLVHIHETFLSIRKKLVDMQTGDAHCMKRKGSAAPGPQ